MRETGETGETYSLIEQLSNLFCNLGLVQTSNLCRVESNWIRFDKSTAVVSNVEQIQSNLIAKLQ